MTHPTHPSRTPSSVDTTRRDELLGCLGDSCNMLIYTTISQHPDTWIPTQELEHIVETTDEKGLAATLNDLTPYVESLIDANLLDQTDDGSELTAPALQPEEQAIVDHISNVPISTGCATRIRDPSPDKSASILIVLEESAVQTTVLKALTDAGGTYEDAIPFYDLVVFSIPEDCLADAYFTDGIKHFEIESTIQATI